MAKNNKDAAFESFLADIEAITPGVKELISKDERAMTKLRAGVLAQSEFNSQMDALRSEKEQMQSYLQEQNQKIAGWQSWYGDATQQFKQMQDQLSAYQSEYGDLDGNQKSRISPEDLDKRMNEQFQYREQAYMKFMDDLTDLKVEHRERFKEKLDTKAVFDISAERKLPLDVAYEIFVADKREAQRKAEVEAQIQAARDEAVREYASKHKLPMLDSNPSYPAVHVVDAQNVGTNQRDRVQAAVDAFRNKS